MVPAPGFFTRAGQELRIPSSRSVAVKLIRSPIASTRTFDKIGMVVFFSTTPCERLNSRTRSILLTVNSIVSPTHLFLGNQVLRNQVPGNQAPALLLFLST